MPFKYGVYGGGTGNTRERPAFNATVFATEDEASRGGEELMLRWLSPTGFTVVEVGDEPNYEFPQGASRPTPIRKEA
jgi:hypothetical protein